MITSSVLRTADVTRVWAPRKAINHDKEVTCEWIPKAAPDAPKYLVVWGQ